MLVTGRFIATLAALVVSTSAVAQWPAKPVHVIVNVAPAGTADVTARLLAPRLSEALGQGVVIDNRGGGDGYVGFDAVVRAEPDGYTLLYTPGSRVMIAPHIVRRPHLALPHGAPRRSGKRSRRFPAARARQPGQGQLRHAGQRHGAAHRRRDL